MKQKSVGGRGVDGDSSSWKCTDARVKSAWKATLFLISQGLRYMLCGKVHTISPLALLSRLADARGGCCTVFSDYQISSRHSTPRTCDQCLKETEIGTEAKNYASPTVSFVLNHVGCLMALPRLSYFLFG